MKKKKCDFCSMKPVFCFDKFYILSENIKTLKGGGWTTLNIGVDEKGKTFLVAIGDGATDYYYPKFCPNCGRRLNED